MSRFSKFLKQSLLAAAILVSASLAVAVSTKDCPLPAGAQEAAYPDDIPQSVLQEFRVHVPKIAGIGERFSATDVVTANLPSRRLIFVRHLGPKWVIAYEHGGRGYHEHVIAYLLDAANGDANLTFNIVALPETVCRAASSWLTGDSPSSSLPGRAARDW